MIKTFWEQTSLPFSGPGVEVTRYNDDQGSFIAWYFKIFTYILLIKLNQLIN